MGKKNPPFKALDNVSLDVFEGENLGIVGESGSGKTTLGNCVIRVLSCSGGEVLFRMADGRIADLAKAGTHELRQVHREIRMVFQDPFASLNPRMTIGQIVGEPLLVAGTHKGEALRKRTEELLDTVGIPGAAMERYPHAFSGGERQRIGIARALALNPRLVVCDEGVSALDVSVRAQILNLLQDLQQDFNLTYIFIAHDLSVVEYISDRVAVMYVGKLVELADTEELYRHPKHPYTEALLSAVPKPDPRLNTMDEGIVLEGDVADPSNPPSGCYFHPRCRYAQDVCRHEEPALSDLGGTGHFVACHFADQLRLNSILNIGQS